MKKNILNLLKKRVSTLELDMKIFTVNYLILFVYSFLIANVLGSLVVILLIVVFFPLIFFIFIPYLTNGYTIGGWLIGVKIINLSNKNNKLSLKKYSKRAIHEFKFFFRRERYSIYSRYPLVKFYPINSYGQFPYDEILNITIITKEIDIDFQKKIEYYEIEDVKKSFDTEGKNRWHKLEFLLLSLWLIIIPITLNLT
ncbi:TPA: hypothetical protein EYP45_04935 [Candidatus Peregrinibacteria bacterium]|nr:hypothetical protein [Candidatus Peregrinibacteria bacterium]